MSKNQIVITTSWDDGHVLDMRLAALLRKYDIKGTFYISPRDREISSENLLTDAQVVELSKDFEIGAHTMTHPRLPLVSNDEARKEIVESKAYLEHVIGREVTSFCYPRGEYTHAHVDMVRNAKYTYARTVERFALDAFPLLASPTSIHVYDHWSDIWALLKLVRFNPITFAHLYHRWDRQAMFLFEKVRTECGVLHLWGHSWEIDAHNDWARLESVLASISGFSDVQHATNAQLI
jgi:peptidoglycan/xylan/chitin deacetylase (PgdA/CDA1 family)